MIGTLVNVAGILAGGVAGLVRRQPLSTPQESFFKVTLGAFTVYYGLRLTWLSLNGSAAQVLKQLAIVVLALMLGKLTGQLLRLQKFSNHLGQSARAGILSAQSNAPGRAGTGFKTCALLFCAAPLGMLGAVQDGLSGYFYPLAVKGVMEGLATFGFVRLFGAGTMLAALPVLVFQGTITLLTSQFLEPFLRGQNLVEPLNAAGGLLVFAVALVILEIKKIELTDYLPSLLFAPLLAWLLR